MKKPRPLRETELARLRAKLDEAEQTLEAIRSGAVDAVVVSAPEGDRVFTLQGADHRYRRIVEGMTEGAVVVSPGGLILYANLAFGDLVATPLEKVLGSPFKRYVSSEASVTFARLLRDARTATVSVDSTVRSASGDVVPVHVSATADDEQIQGGVCLIVTNLTSVIQEAEKRFQFVADMLPQIIWSAGPGGELEYFNRRWLELTGLTLAETRAQGWDAAVHPEDRARCADEWARSRVTGQVYEVTHRLRRADGAYRWHLARALPQRAGDGTTLRWFGSYTDIESERALGAEAERARDKAEEATRLKDEFLATLSHELRTPLNAILGWARLLQGGTLKDGQRPRAVDTIVRNAVAQNQLIEDLLDVSRIISGKLRLNVGPVQIALVIEAALDVVRPAADAKGVTLHPVTDPDVGEVSGDAGRLQQVIWNLLANAVKFTAKGGRVVVTLRRRESSAEIEVSDTGLGIAPDFLPYVFDRFRQQDGAITRRAGGLGLGLAIVKNIVELHGGIVEAHSDGPNRGSVFLVRLPIMPVKPSTLPPPELRVGGDSALQAEVSGLRVLVIDDEPDARDLLRELFERSDAVVTTAASAAEGLVLVPLMKPDIIVSDIGMPGEDGYAFIRKLRAQPREEGGRTPAVALTAYARPEDRTRALIAGFQTHATKPVEPHELLVVVANLAGRFA